LRLLVTGGTGRLGRELRRLLPEAAYLGRAHGDIGDAAWLKSMLEQVRPTLVLHLAAWTDVAGAERERAACFKVNVEGTRTLVRVCPAPVVYLSTDYVFRGDQGGYREGDPLDPVNYYAFTKALGEEAARRAARCLVIRTSFKPSEFPHPVAYDDLYTSADYVDVIAALIAPVLNSFEDLPEDLDTLHVGTGRKSVYDLVVRRNPGVRRGRRAEAPVTLPADTSLDTTRYRALAEALGWSRPVEES
jgi:dTDP-4-dehydrorhamnose reductase